MRRLGVCILLFTSAAGASQPTQPLDCSDWVFLEPGYSCRERRVCDNSVNLTSGCFTGNQSIQLDPASGLVFAWRYLTGATCGNVTLQRLELVRESETQPHVVIGYVDERCVTPTPMAEVVDLMVLNNGVLFDSKRGELLLAATSTNRIGSYSRRVLFAITGFATDNEVLQTFTPQASLNFRVPSVPEGLPAVDHFDTYWGPLTKPLDFTQAHALACDYPAIQPSPGDYIELADTVPMPAPGQGAYYVTAVTYQGQVRYGRKASGGVLSGRDPDVLPACSSP